jgi:hypothetical protein
MKYFSAKLYIPAMLFVMTAGVLAMLKMGYKVDPVDVMSPSFFDDPEEIGAVVYRRFYTDIELRKRVVFGIPPQPDYHRLIVRGFLKAAMVEKHPFEALISEQQTIPLDLKDLPPLETVTVPTNTDTQAELVDAIKRFDGKRLLIYLPSVFSTHLLPGIVITRLEAVLQENLLTITTGPLALRPDQEYRVDPPCLGSERDTSGTSALGCAILQSGRMNYLKKVKQERWVAIMNEQRPGDNLLMISEPGQDKNNGEGNRKLRMSPPQPPAGESSD